MKRRFMKERPILVAVIGVITGILWGLYFNFSIVLCYIPILAIYLFYQKMRKLHSKKQFKLISWSRYSRYIKLIFSRKVIFLFLIFSIISNVIVLYQNDQYENSYQEGQEVEITGIIVSEKIEKQYYNLYQIKLLNRKNKDCYIQVSKKEKDMQYADKVKLQGTYRKPSKQRNYGGYNDEQYLKTLKIIGRIKVNKIEVIEKKQLNKILQVGHDISLNIEEKIEASFDQEKASILKGILLGKTEEMQEEIKEKFQIANISHILAISGMHISYLVVGLQLILKKITGKKKTKIITIVILIMYSIITGFSPSVVRAVTMAIITIGASLIYRKSDVGNSIAISLLGILMYNPFLLLNIGLQLSYFGTIGIILFRPVILKILSWVKQEKVKEIIGVSLSAQITILPIILYHFNIFGIYFLITNLLTSLIIGPIIILAFFRYFSILYISWNSFIFLFYFKNRFRIIKVYF